MKTINLKKATLDNMDDLLSLEKSVDGVKTYSTIITAEEWITELENNEVFLIEIEGKVVGSVAYEIKNQNHAYISGLVIYPQFQGKGIARQAMTEILKEIELFKRIDLVTHPDNMKAIRLYESLGFVAESKKENYFGDGEPRIVMARVLK